jgi:hypothetical protein
MNFEPFKALPSMQKFLTALETVKFLREVGLAPWSCGIVSSCGVLGRDIKSRQGIYSQGIHRALTLKKSFFKTVN